MDVPEILCYICSELDFWSALELSRASKKLHDSIDLRKQKVESRVIKIGTYTKTITPNPLSRNLAVIEYFGKRIRIIRSRAKIIIKYKDTKYFMGPVNYEDQFTEKREEEDLGEFEITFFKKKYKSAIEYCCMEDHALTFLVKYSAKKVKLLVDGKEKYSS